MFYPTLSFVVLRRWCVLLGALLLLAPRAHAASDQLKDQPSAFLQSYTGGPVDWMPWGEAAFARAKTEGKPVLLVIGSFTSELSRAMNRQTFSNKETAEFLNSSFVCILVDAKERRDVASLYSQYLQDVKQLTGLPMNLFLTPELKPFDGANYLPPTEEWGKEGFSTVAKRAAAGWKADPAAQRAKADEAVATVTSAQPIDPSNAVAASDLKQVLADATEAWRARFDATNGGFSEPPKYPEPELLRFLLRDPAAKEMALTTLRAIAAGAVRDPLDGGFFRYAVDAEWRHPYFQKTLSDQARLSLAFLDAAKLTGDALFGDAARGALNYALNQLRASNGDFASAEDATLEAATNAHLWTLSELQDVLGDAAAKSFAATYSVTAAGNIPADAFPGVTTTGKNILYRAPTAAPGIEETSLKDSAAKLLAKRIQRSAPSRDDAATAATHGLLLEALSTAGAQLKDAALTKAAQQELSFITTKLVAADGSVKRFADRPLPGAPEDYAFLFKGLTAYSGAVSGDAKAGTLASAVLKRMNADFWNAKTGRYFTTTAAESTGLWARVVAPVNTQADLPTIESALLGALTSNPSADSSTTELITALRGNASADVRDSAEVARGDLLLSLRSDAP
jgi:uncharacterized protein